MHAQMPSIRLKRAYAPPEENDGLRILVDRLWPRGIRKEDLQLDGWGKELAPSGVLRKWFAHDPQRWPEFKRLSLEELDGHGEEMAELAAKASQARMTLVYAARDEQHNHALVLKEYLDKLLANGVVTGG